MTIPRERLVVIAGAAQEAFWKAVAEMLPEAKTGDMDVGAVMEFSRACDKAVEIWARTNVRGAHVDELPHLQTAVYDAIAPQLADDNRRGITSMQIRDEIIANVGMMASARTPEMQLRYEAALIRESRAIASPPRDFEIVDAHDCDDPDCQRCAHWVG